MESEELIRLVDKIVIEHAKVLKDNERMYIKWDDMKGLRDLAEDKLEKALDENARLRQKLYDAEDRIDTLKVNIRELEEYYQDAVRNLNNAE